MIMEETEKVYFAGVEYWMLSKLCLLAISIHLTNMLIAELELNL